MIDVYRKNVGKTFQVRETFGIITKGLRLYCISENDESIFCVASEDVCGVNHVRLSKVHLTKLIEL
jgi:hypothetical protein